MAKFFQSCLVVFVGCSLAALQAAEPKRDAEGQPIVGPVHSARSLLGAELKNASGQVLGKIEDVGIDIGRGSAVEVFLMPAAVGDEKRESLGVPMTTLQWGEKNTVTVTSSATKLPQPAEAGDPQAKSQVIMLTALQDIPVQNARGEKLGQVVDFALAHQQGLIAYAVFVNAADGKSADKLYPIPLSAFVVPQGSKAWILELPEDLLTNTPTFAHDRWPGTVSRTWLVYGAVRFGSSPLAGVQYQLSAEKK